ncbi:glutathione S-transferase A-like [Kryptolebias marmoratus]|uniref:Glutathione S-transferase rho n=1 Tax=Kryptolebias marmoratus TaxID=37003 RepID=Q15BH3_KRYMA|nr:glutathione S-transferase A-like [Kryptolebias marmoratus]ABF70330.1 glutathione S-transferase theta-class [Kryptolebias marmoratus]ABQ23902.1 glutathione S-transferase theta-class [Kryptolebias marmoratus]
MAKDMTLYWGSGSPPCWRVMIALEEKNLQGYNSKLLSFEKGEHKSKEVMDVNCRGQLPAFKDGKIIVNESYGICLYLEDRYKSKGTKLIPDNPDEMALMHQRMFEGLTLFQKMAQSLFYTRFVPENERHASAEERNRGELREEVQRWENYMKCDYLAGKHFTMADVIVFPVIAFLFRFGLCEEKYAKLAAYYKNLKDRPSIKSTWPPSWKDSPGMDTLKSL